MRCMKMIATVAVILSILVAAWFPLAARIATVLAVPLTMIVADVGSESATASAAVAAKLTMAYFLHAEHDHLR